MSRKIEKNKKKLFFYILQKEKYAKNTFQAFFLIFKSLTLQNKTIIVLDPYHIVYRSSHMRDYNHT